MNNIKIDSKKNVPITMSKKYIFDFYIYPTKHIKVNLINFVKSNYSYTLHVITIVSSPFLQLISFGKLNI